MGRRLTYWALVRHGEAVDSYLEGSRLILPRFMVKPLAPAVIRILARDHKSRDEAVRADLATLPGLLDRIDGWIADGVLGGAEPNVADYQVATSLALLVSHDDLRPHDRGAARGPARASGSRRATRAGCRRRSRPTGSPERPSPPEHRSTRATSSASSCGRRALERHDGVVALGREGHDRQVRPAGGEHDPGRRLDLAVVERLAAVPAVDELGVGPRLEHELARRGDAAVDREVALGQGHRASSVTCDDGALDRRPAAVARLHGRARPRALLRCARRRG